jgi:hypothetical protein
MCPRFGNRVYSPRALKAVTQNVGLGARAYYSKTSRRFELSSAPSLVVSKEDDTPHGVNQRHRSAASACRARAPPTPRSLYTLPPQLRLLLTHRTERFGTRHVRRVRAPLQARANRPCVIAGRLHATGRRHARWYGRVPKRAAASRRAARRMHTRLPWLFGARRRTWPLPCNGAGVCARKRLCSGWNGRSGARPRGGACRRA